MKNHTKIKKGEGMKRVLCLLVVSQLILPTKSQLQKRASRASSYQDENKTEMWEDYYEGKNDPYERDDDSCLKTTCFSCGSVCLLCVALCLGPLIHKIQAK